MKVMKFGGTSVGKPQRMFGVADLVTHQHEPTIVVLSALSGTTNALVTISQCLSANEREQGKRKVDELQQHYFKFVDELVQTEAAKAEALNVVKEHFEFLNIIFKISYSEALEKDILAQGELLSTKLFCVYLREKGIDHVLLPALEFMQIDSASEPLIGNIKVKLTQLIDSYPGQKLFITQGYICRNSKGEVDNLKRGGSDYTASLVAAAIGASVCEIWTDIDGMHNNDPRVVDKTVPIEQLSFDEAAELAYFGAKILHPASIWPAQHYNVPVKLLNTMDPAAKGTLIEAQPGSVGVKAVAAKDGIIAINIKSSRMLLAYGFLRKIFEVFEKYQSPIYMITTYKVAVSVNQERLLNELGTFGNIEVDNNQTIISVVGNEIAETPDVMKKLFDTIAEVPVRMVSYGGSRHNISLLIPSEYKTKSLQLLNKGVFGL